MDEDDYKSIDGLTYNHSLIQFKIEVKDTDNFHHFQLDSPRFTPYTDDERVIVGSLN